MTTPPAGPGRPRAGPGDPTDLEAVIDGVPFAGLPLGGTLAAHLLMLRGGVPPAPGRDALRLASNLVAAARPRPAGPGAAPREVDVVVIWSHDEARVTDLLAPVVEELAGRARVVVVGRSGADGRRFGPGVEVVARDRLGPLDGATWARHAGRAAPDWVGATVRAAGAGTLAPSAVPGTLGLLLGQSQQVLRARELFAALRPGVVLADYDRSTLAAPLVLAARSSGIPTVTLVHGAVGERGYTPLLADTVLSWGPRQVAALARAGVDPGRIEVTGCPRVSDAPLPDREPIAVHLGLDPGLRVVTLGTNLSGSLSGRQHLAEVFCRAVEGLDGVQGLVRCHPSEDLAAYAALRLRYPRILWQDARALTLEECLSLSDVVVYRRTGLGNDAVLHGRLAVVLEPPGGLPTRENELALGPEGPVARSAEDLRALLVRHRDDATFRASWADRIDEAAAEICVARGREAARRTADAVLARVPERDRTGTAPEAEPAPGPPSPGRRARRPGALARLAPWRSSPLTDEERAKFGISASDPEGARAFLSHREYLTLRPAMDEEHWRPLVHSKWVFATHCAATGILTPPVLGVLEPRGGFAVGGGRLRSAADLLALVEAERLGSFVLKPVTGGQGEGVLLVEAAGVAGDGEVQLRTSSGRTVTEPEIEALIRQSFSGARGWLVQEMAPLHPDLRRLVGPGQTISVRIVTLRLRDGTIQPELAFARVSHTGSELDNTSRGGIAVPLDLATGALGVGRQWRDGRWWPIEAHPDTGVTFASVGGLPGWDDLVALVRRGSDTLPGLHSVAWDLVVTPDGPSVIEANVGWAHITAQVFYGGFFADGTVARWVEELGAEMPDRSPGWWWRHDPRTRRARRVVAAVRRSVGR